MAQTTPDNPTEGVPRPLPRGIRPARVRDSRPRFQPLDAVWIALLATLYAVINYPEWGIRHIGLYCMCAGIGTVALTYLLGWRASGRSAGVIAGLLLATSTTFGGMSLDTLGVTLFALITMAALFAFVAGSSLAALALAVAAVVLRPDSFLLGLMLLTLSLVQKRQRAVLGAALFLVPTIAVWAYLLATGQGAGYTHAFGINLDTLAWIVLPGTVFFSWFLLPFLGELGDPIRRARWLPVIWWTGLYLLLETFLMYDRGDSGIPALVPFLPLWFVLAAAGIARLLPMMTGDIPIPNLRYVIATLAVVALLGVRMRLEVPSQQRQTMAPVNPTTPAPVDVPSPPAAAPAEDLPPGTPIIVPRKPVKPLKPSAKRPLTVKPKTLSKAAKPLPKNPLAVKPMAPVKPANAKPTVPLYTVKNGRLVKRSKWAIQWDQTHPKP